MQYHLTGTVNEVTLHGLNIDTPNAFVRFYQYNLASNGNHGALLGKQVRVTVTIEEEPHGI